MILTVTPNPAVDVAYFVDKFEMGEVHRPLRSVVTAGGKGLNVARVARTLGEKVVAMGFAGGSNGDFILSEVDRLGIGNAFTRIAGETRRNTDIIDSAGVCGEILEKGPTVTAEEERLFLERYAEEVERCDFVCASGSLPQGLDGGFYCKLVAIAREKGKRILVDTSGSNLDAVIDSRPFMIKPNSDEMKALFGNIDTAEGLRTLFERGVELPFVTLGGDGAILLDGGRAYRFVIPSLKVKNTVGSGDSTVAGIAVGLCRGMSPKDAVRLGMASGMANTQFEETGTVTAELVEKFYHRVEFFEI